MDRKLNDRETAERDQLLAVVPNAVGPEYPSAPPYDHNDPESMNSVRRPSC